jgi:hypothetical protein
METFSVGNMRLKHNIGFEIMRENNELFSFSLFFSTPLSTIFLLYRGGKFHWWRKPEYLEKTTVSLFSLLDLQLHMQSVPITTNVESSLAAQARCTRYNICQ